MNEADCGMRGGFEVKTKKKNTNKSIDKMEFSKIGQPRNKR